MQDTRLTRILETTSSRLGSWFRNPWRRLSAQIISLLGGFFIASSLAAIAGQAAIWDTTIAAILVLLIELVNWLMARTKPRPLLLELLNYAKVGFIYCLFLEAFKLGS
jgi:hypothetical protein